MMNLFGETGIFDEGKQQFTDFSLPDTDLRLWSRFFTKAESDRYFTVFKTTCPWQQQQRWMYDKWVTDPRMTAWYGGSRGLPWTPELLEIKACIEANHTVSFNRVLLNYYRDGNDSVAWHCDTLPSGGVHHPIASVTFGDTRIFKVRHLSKKDVQPLSIPLTHGSLLWMAASMQDYYEHQVPKTTRPVGPRINLTFRISDH